MMFRKTHFVSMEVKNSLKKECPYNVLNKSILKSLEDSMRMIEEMKEVDEK